MFMKVAFEKNLISNVVTNFRISVKGSGISMSVSAPYGIMYSDAWYENSYYNHADFQVDGVVVVAAFVVLCFLLHYIQQVVVRE